MEEALMSYDSCTGLIRGFYSKFSKDINQLIKLTAQEGVELHTAKYRLKSSKQICSVLANKICMNWAMVLVCGNADIILPNLHFVCSSTADEDCYSQFSDQHSCWNKKHEEYCYAYKEFHRLHMGSFRGWHCC